MGEYRATIIGAGIMGMGVGRVVQRMPNVKLCAVADPVAEKRDTAAKEFSVPAYDNYDEMLEKEAPELCFVATPDWLHVEPVMACLSRGIHVYVEKPLTTKVDEAVAIVRRVRETGLKLQVSYNHRWLAPYHLTHEKIRCGAVGRPLMGYARKNNPISVPTQMLASWAKDSSPMWFQSSHDIDLMCWWFDDEPVDVVCHGVKRVLRERYGWDTYDALQGQVRFAQGGMATFEASWIYPDTHPSMPDSFMAIIGEKGHLQIDRKDEAVEMSSEKRFNWPRSLLNYKVFDRWVGAFPSCIESFIDAIEADREPYVNAMDGWRATAVLDALHRAADTGDRVEVPAMP